MKRLSMYVGIPLLTIGLAAAGFLLVNRNPSARAATPEEVRAEIIPSVGEPTAYDLPLSLDNTQRFIDYYEATSLSAEQEQILEEALLPLKAPCCDDNPMSTCCCDCNLAKSVWGLSSYLIAEKDLGVDAVQDSALQWLRFIHSDYYIGRELADRGVNPDRYDLPRGDSCYTGRCELPFADSGCGGMGILRQ
ncbi:MAG: hypothetical protein PVJ55_04590 [Anaerolineae bacterium]